MDLRTTLTGFADQLLASEDTTEAVKVEVTRVAGFQNEATTAAGQHLLIDEPVHFGGRGEAPDPAQLLLGAVGASLSVTLTAHATLRGLELRSISSSLKASIDGRAFFHPSTDARPGLLDMRIALSVTSPASEADFRGLLDDVLQATPVLQTLKQMPEIELRYSQVR